MWFGSRVVAFDCGHWFAVLAMRVVVCDRSRVRSQAVRGGRWSVLCFVAEVAQKLDHLRDLPRRPEWWSARVLLRCAAVRLMCRLQLSASRVTCGT